ncbi:MAG: NAD(P)-dependent oxidoreductase [Bacteroidetes bacterium]|nr:MAG: NAD(P)-dependent oxidoreductase [Bacteroidota bacterium]
MKSNNMHIAILGLGEAGSIFANDLAAMGITVSGWDPNLKRTLNERVRFAKNNLDAAKDADIILSVNLSSASEAIAKEVLPALNAGKIYAEMNTSAPQKKYAIFEIIKPSGAQYVDLAIMAPVPPKGIKTPFIASGPGAKQMKEQLANLQLNFSFLSNNVGDASTRKLLRSIVYKGVAAVICEALESAKVFGLEPYIREQILSIIGGNETLIDRFVEGSYLHTERRIQEMEAVIQMLEEKDIQPFASIAARNNLEKIMRSKN